MTKQKNCFVALIEVSITTNSKDFSPFFIIELSIKLFSTLDEAFDPHFMVFNFRLFSNTQNVSSSVILLHQINVIFNNFTHNKPSLNRFVCLL